MNKCEVCGYLHYRTDPCRVAKKSTAAAKVPHGALQEAQGVTRVAKQDISGCVTVKPVAGTQALPVDTSGGSPNGRSVDYKSSRGGSIPPPPAKFNKAAWMRANMPAFMRKYRAEVKAGIRVPKPRGTK